MMNKYPKLIKLNVSYSKTAVTLLKLGLRSIKCIYLKFYSDMKPSN